MHKDLKDQVIKINSKLAYGAVDTNFFIPLMTLDELSDEDLNYVYNEFNDYTWEKYFSHISSFYEDRSR